MREHGEYILPARFDSTKVPGLLETVHYIDLRRTKPAELAALIRTKVGARQRERFFPRRFPTDCSPSWEPTRDRTANESPGNAQAFHFALTRMTEEERRLLFYVFSDGCPTELPANVHINLDLLRRLSGMGPSSAFRVLAATASLGVEAKVRKARPGDGEGDLLVVQWHDMRVENPNPDSNATDVAAAVVDTVTDLVCSECAKETLARLDFSNLSTATAEAEVHKRRQTRKKA